jgi:hypothetical protein
MSDDDKHVFETPDNIPLFECTKRGHYIYLGKDYPYTGACIHGGTKDVYGKWKDGVFSKANKKER